MAYPRDPGYKEGSTSRDSARRIAGKAATVRAEVMHVYFNKNADGYTADEVAAILQESILTVRPRVSELIQQGVLEDSGNRRPNRSGHSAKVLRWVRRQGELFTWD